MAEFAGERARRAVEGVVDEAERPHVPLGRRRGGHECRGGRVVHGKQALDTGPHRRDAREAIEPVGAVAPRGAAAGLVERSQAHTFRVPAGRRRWLRRRGRQRRGR